MHDHRHTHVGLLLRRWPTEERRQDGFPVAVHHLFAVYPDGEEGAVYPMQMTVETVMADPSSGPVLDVLEADARRRLHSLFSASMADVSYIGGC